MNRYGKVLKMAAQESGATEIKINKGKGLHQQIRGLKRPNDGQFIYGHFQFNLLLSR